jgi:hypothetical protein
MWSLKIGTKLPSCLTGCSYLSWSCRADARAICSIGASFKQPFVAINQQLYQWCFKGYLAPNLIHWSIRILILKVTFHLKRSFEFQRIRKLLTDKYTERNLNVHAMPLKAKFMQYIRLDWNITCSSLTPHISTPCMNKVAILVWTHQLVLVILINQPYVLLPRPRMISIS